MLKTDVYYASDKDIFDALASKKKYFSMPVLTELCRDRGIFISNDDEREDVIDYISILPHAVQDLQFIQEHVQANSKTEQKTSTKIVGNTIIETNITEAVTKLKDSRSEKFNEKYQTIESSENKIIIDIDYQEVDWGATRLKQKQDKTARIEIRKDDDGSISIRHSANDRIKTLAQQLVDSIKQTVKPEDQKNLIQRNIDFTKMKDSDCRTSFFTGLLNSIDELKLEEVSGIKVSSLLEEHTDDERVDEMKQEVLGKLQSAIFKGENLLETPEYMNFKENGFYIYGITWKARNKKGDKIVLTCSFEDSENCVGFEYDVKGIYQLKNDEYLKTLKPIEGIEKDTILLNIEKSALLLFDKIEKEYGESKND